MTMYNDDELNAEESAVMHWQFFPLGGFESALWSAITKADTQNLNALELGFPAEVGGYKKYSHVSGWFEGVQDRAFRKIVS